MDSQINSASAGGVVIAAQHGNIDVHQWEPRYHLEPFRAEAAEPTSPVSQPSRLLAASSRVVEFYGRHTELETLRRWRDATESAFSMQLWHGRGGQGKTRLAAEFALRSIRDGWTVVQAHQFGFGKAPAPQGKTLLLVDYAERWAAGDLWALLVDGRWHGTAETRALLLARSAGSWWNSLVSKLERYLGFTPEAHLLDSLARNAPEHAALFRVARDRYAELFGAPAEDIDPPSSLEGDAQGSVLGVHMAALASVYARISGERLGGDPSAVSIYLLRREWEHWQRMHEDAGRPSRPETLARAVYLSQLTRALPYAAATQALAKAGVASTAEAAGQVLDDHAFVYPPADPAVVLEPMYPDRLGEDFYALQTPGHSLDGHRPDPWALGAPLALADDAPRMLYTLIEVARRWPHVAQRQLFPLLRERPDVALHAGGRALSALAELPDLDLSVADAIDGSHPGAHADLDDALATLSSLLAERRLERETEPVRQAVMQHRHAARLLAIGRFEQAEDPARHAVELLRRGSVPEPTPLLAEALGTLSRVLFGLGRDAEARNCALAALRIWQRSPARTTQQEVLHAELLAVAGQPREAHRLWERLASENAILLPRLAASHQALGEWAQAVRIWRELAGSAPRHYEPRLGYALTCLGTEPALSEAVGIYRRLAAFDVTYRPHLVRCIALLVRLRPGLSLLDEAIALPLPDRFRVDRARVLHMFALASVDSGERLEDALRHVLEAISILREAGKAGEARQAQGTCTTLLRMQQRHADVSRIRSLLEPPTPPRRRAPVPVPDFDYAAYDSVPQLPAPRARGVPDCPACGGSGHVSVAGQDSTCAACIGTGKVGNGLGLRPRQRCVECGERIDLDIKCTECGGRGRRYSRW